MDVHTDSHVTTKIFEIDGLTNFYGGLTCRIEGHLLTPH